MFISVDEIDTKKIKSDFDRTKVIASRYLTKETIKSIKINKIQPNITELRLYPCPQFPDGYIVMRNVANITEGKKVLLGLLTRMTKIKQIEKLFHVRNEFYIDEMDKIKSICENEITSRTYLYRVVINGCTIGDLYDYLTNVI